MGKIDSREIGEVDPRTDSANSLLLIKYATESQSILLSAAERGSSPRMRGRNISHHLSVHCLPLGI